MSLKQEIEFSLWCDFIERDFIEGEFKEIIADGTIYGATSNPAIFEKAIRTSDAYAEQKRILQANEPKKIYEELAITDIKKAALALRDLYENDSNDGFVSIEVDPFYCDDAKATIEEGIRIFNAINEPNVMIKIPATQAGYEAMEELTSRGISVNATLIFSPSQATKCAQALDRGISKSTKDTKGVVSVFVSRFDRACDEILKEKGLETGRLGVMNAIKCYHNVEAVGNKNIRTLFASTGVKGDDLPKSYYIDELIYPNSVNTAPLDTIKAWLESGSKQPSEVISNEKCDLYFEKLEENSIDINSVYEKLLVDGLEAFKVSFKTLLASFEE
jgi:transaldolase